MQAVSALIEQSYSPLDSANNPETERGPRFQRAGPTAGVGGHGIAKMPGPPDHKLLIVDKRHNACRDRANRVSAGQPRRIEQALKVNHCYPDRCTASIARSCPVIRH